MKIFYGNDFNLMKDGYDLNPTAPFKGICQHCKQRTIVRNYAYNVYERLGTLCKECFNEIDKELSYCYNINDLEDLL